MRHPLFVLLCRYLQVYSAVALIKRFYQEQNNTDLIINNVQNVLTLAFDIRDKKKEHLICPHLL
jgi:hypothetical protein